MTVNPAIERSEDSEDEGWVSGDGSVSFDSDDDQWEDPCSGALGELLQACEDGHADKVPELLEKLQEAGVSVDHRGRDGDSALHSACLYGHTEIVDLLLAAGADAKLADGNGGTPLHDAAAGGFDTIVQRLLAVHAEGGIHNLADKDGDTPLHNAARGNHEGVAAMLLDAGSEATAQNEGGKTPCDLCDKNTALHTLLRRAAGLDVTISPPPQ
mmetsp:Transcript_4926/g.10060  ORF Transcript_4926/g.10060 Transcript_4926/m.10060 type:complete len:213 (-) Transcript_4926:293-931(-)|eukprot:CAMPEP_0118926824 /NCGR_PEP_ID=MMETSP1169-20130426/4437_1 /TAXON_ID=36882 /ORGANISM="Pyramimonas obovata, Strain CCMP722" /LENGTH=212 /DNA_ID=CAMNT_0006868457 /DNA_START=72 /DNA_END=710 /DNA_ORIENTATION=-